MSQPSGRPLLDWIDSRHGARPQLHRHVRSRASRDLCYFVKHSSHGNSVVNVTVQVMLNLLMGFTFQLTTWQAPNTESSGEGNVLQSAGADAVPLQASQEEAATSDLSTPGQTCLLCNHFNLLQIMKLKQTTNSTRFDFQRLRSSLLRTP